MTMSEIRDFMKSLGFAEPIHTPGGTASGNAPPLTSSQASVTGSTRGFSLALATPAASSSTGRETGA